MKDRRSEQGEDDVRHRQFQKNKKAEGVVHGIAPELQAILDARVTFHQERVAREMGQMNYNPKGERK